MNATRRNLWSAAIAGAVCAALIAVMAALQVNTRTDNQLQRPSSFFTDSTGARGIYLVLEEVLPSVEQWRRPLTALPDPAGGPSTLILMRSEAASQSGAMMGASFGALSATEADALDRWVSSGGQLILATDSDWPIASRQSAGTGYLKRRGLEIQKPADGADPIQAATTAPVGRGRIVIVPDPGAFSNRTLRETDNAFWLASRCAEWGNGWVAFDESHQGFGARRSFFGLMGAFFQSPWGLVTLQWILAGALYVFGIKSRFGRTVEEPVLKRTSPIESAQALGGLFETGQARALAARAIHQHLADRIFAALGYRVDLLNEAHRARLANRPGITGGELERYAEAVRRAIYYRRATGADLIDIGRGAAAILRGLHHENRTRRPAAAG